MLEDSDPTIHAVVTKYGYFDIFRFLSPISYFRKKPIERITTLIRDEIDRRPEKLSVIAHSFGTYIVSEILQITTDIKFDRLILCGSIVKEDFKWDAYKHRLAPDDELDWKVVNDCGTKDLMPVLALTMSGAYGSSGRFGFGSGVVLDRFHSIGHSDFFEKNFIVEFWLPYLQNGQIVPGELTGITPTWWWNWISLVKFWKLATLALLIGFGITVYNFNQFRSQPIAPPPLAILGKVFVSGFSQGNERVEEAQRPRVEFRGRDVLQEKPVDAGNAKEGWKWASIPEPTLYKQVAGEKGTCGSAHVSSEDSSKLIASAQLQSVFNGLGNGRGPGWVNCIFEATRYRMSSHRIPFVRPEQTLFAKTPLRIDLPPSVVHFEARIALTGGRSINLSDNDMNDSLISAQREGTTLILTPVLP